MIVKGYMGQKDKNGKGYRREVQNFYEVLRRARRRETKEYLIKKVKL